MLNHDASVVIGGADAIQEMHAIERSSRRRKSSKPGTLRGGYIPDLTWGVRNGHKVLHVPEGWVPTPEWERAHGHRLLEVAPGQRIPVLAGGSRQYFMDTLNEPPIANLTAVTATTETILWNVSNYSPIAANDCRPGKIYKLTAGGIWTNATTGTLLITPRFGLTVGAGITMGANVTAQTVSGTAVTSNAWTLEFILICRTVGAPGVNSTVIGTGLWVTSTRGAADVSMCLGFGGTSASVDVSIATGIVIGWTLSVAGTVTPQYAFIQSLN